MGNANPGIVSSTENATQRGDMPLGLNIAIASGKKNVLDYVVKYGVKNDLDMGTMFKKNATKAPNFTTYDADNVAAPQNDVVATYSGGGSPTDELAAARAAGPNVPTRAVKRPEERGTFLARLLGR